MLTEKGLGALKSNRRDPSRLLELQKIFRPDQQQVDLTERLIVPNAVAIVSDVEELRHHLDESLRDNETMAKKSGLNKNQYPMGFCREIRDAVFKELQDKLSKTDFTAQDNPGLQAITNFLRAGGIAKPFWGIQKEGRYFHNAIQMGNAILDVVNDTIVGHEEHPVVLHPNLAESPFQNIESMTQLADIAEHYWKYDVYPNIYLPNLAPICPILAIEQFDLKGGSNMDKFRVLTVMSSVEHLVFNNLYTVADGHLFGLASDFLFKGRYAEKRLPPAMLEMLMSEDNPGLQEIMAVDPEILRISNDPKETQTVFAQFHIDKRAKEIPEEYFKKMGRIGKVAGQINRIPLAFIPAD